MKLRSKALLIAGTALVSLIVVLYVFATTIVLNGFARIEEQNTRENVERALTAVSDELANLSSINRDYASWDDTYTFVEDANDDYPKVNLVDTTFMNLRLNLMVFIHSSGQVVFSKAFDLQNDQEIPVPASLQDHLFATSLLLRHSGPESDLTGILLLPEGPMLISSRPILTSEYQGPIRGTLVFGRYLDSAEIEQLAQTTHLSLTLRRFDDPEMPSDLQTMRASLSEETPTLIRPLSAQSIAGYSLIKDIYEKPALLLRVDLTRTIYQQGESTIRYFILSLLVAGLIIGAVTLWLVERMILSRLTRLSASVNHVGASGDLSARVQLGGKDELSSLASAFNNLVARLQQTVEDLETRVVERTAELAEASGKLSRRASQLQAGAEIARAASTLLDPDSLISQVVNLIQEQFGFYYVGLFTVDESGRYAVLRQGTGEAGWVLRESKHRLEVGGNSMVGWVCDKKQARVASDVGQDAVRFAPGTAQGFAPGTSQGVANPLLPDTRSEMALPLRIGDRVIGALDVHSVQAAAFDEDNVATLQGMADQISTALENARLFQQTQKALQERDLLSGLLVREGWQGYLTQMQSARSAEFGETGIQPAGPDSKFTLRIPLELRGQTLGTLVMERSSDGQPWQSDEAETIRAIAEQATLALDSARLFEEAQMAAARERLLNEITARIRSTATLDGVLNSAVREISALTGASYAAIDLELEPIK